MRLAALLVCTALPAFAEAPAVATDVMPTWGLTSAIMEGVDGPVVVAEGDWHETSLDPEAAQALDEATLVIRIEGTLPWIEDAIGELAPDAQILVLESPAAGEEDGHGDAHADDGHGDEGHDDHHDEGHDDHAEADHHGHDHGGVDPHGWLDPDVALGWAGQIAEALSAQDPENAERYAANLAALREEVEGIEARIRAAIPDGLDVVAAHDGWGHAERAFGFEVLAFATDLTHGAATPRDIAALSEAAPRAACLLAANENEAAALSEIVGDLPVGLAGPDGVGLPFVPEFYPMLLTRLAIALETCAEAAA